MRKFWPHCVSGILLHLLLLQLSCSFCSYQKIEISLRLSMDPLNYLPRVCMAIVFLLLCSEKPTFLCLTVCLSVSVLVGWVSFSGTAKEKGFHLKLGWNKCSQCSFYVVPKHTNQTESHFPVFLLDRTHPAAPCGVECQEVDISLAGSVFNWWLTTDVINTQASILNRPTLFFLMFYPRVPLWNEAPALS